LYGSGNAFFLLDAQPTEGEAGIFHELEGVLQRAQMIINEVSQYPGASKEIKEVS